MAYPNDISNIAELFEDENFIESKFSLLDVLVNNASMLGKKVDILDYPTDLWNEVFKINLNAQFYVIKTLLPLLLKSNNVSIIDSNSTLGRSGRSTLSA